MSAAPQAAAAGGMRRLHLGGSVRTPGWTVLNIQPGEHVDVVGCCTDLGMFADASLDAVYASHVLEHLSYAGEVQKAMGEVRRVLRPDGLFYISVPDLDVLCRFFTDPSLDIEKKFHVMRVIYGGQTDSHDFHKTGYNWGFLVHFLQKAGFSSVQRVSRLGIFADTSNAAYLGHSICLNAIATA